jgi:hypothetical protein
MAAAVVQNDTRQKMQDWIIEPGHLFSECPEDWIDEDNPIRMIDEFVDGLDLSGLGFDRVFAPATGRPSYHFLQRPGCNGVG